MTSRSDHFDGHRFFNPGGTNGQPFWKLPQLLMTPRTPWPSRVAVTQQRPPSAGADEVIVTFIGHASFLVQAGPAAVLIDPVYVERASPVQWGGPRRVRAPGVRLEDLPPISFVLLSHNHYDHCDLATLRRIARPIVTPLGNARLLRGAGLTTIEELDWWDAAKTAPLPVTLTPAQHFSARHMFDRNRALWGGFLLEALGRRIYFAGDSGYGPHFKEIGRRLSPIDLALIPIGAYEPRWFMKDIHVNPEEAVQAHLDVQARQSIAMHFGTFQLTPEGIDAPVQNLETALGANGLSARDFGVMGVGESITIARS